MPLRYGVDGQDYLGAERFVLLQRHKLLSNKLCQTINARNQMLLTEESETDKMSSRMWHSRQDDEWQVTAKKSLGIPNDWSTERWKNLPN